MVEKANAGSFFYSESDGISHSTERKPERILYLVVFFWLSFVVVGILLLINYSYVSNAPDAIDQRSWPTDSDVSHTVGKKHLVVFLHPKCTCSFATIVQLAHAVHGFDQQLIQLTAIFYCPDKTDENWVKTGLWKETQKIPGLVPFIDYQGIETDKFGVHTSGHVAFFDTAGHRVYNGGITSARAHEGENIGANAIRSLIRGLPNGYFGSPVFGCQIFEEVGS